MAFADGSPFKSIIPGIATIFKATIDIQIEKPEAAFMRDRGVRSIVANVMPALEGNQKECTFVRRLLGSNSQNAWVIQRLSQIVSKSLTVETGSLWSFRDNLSVLPNVDRRAEHSCGLSGAARCR